MKKFLKSILSIVTIAPITVATMLPAATIGRSLSFKNSNTVQLQTLSHSYTGGQTLVTAPNRSNDIQAFDFSQLKLEFEKLPEPEITTNATPNPEITTITKQTAKTDETGSSTSALYTLGDLMFQGVIYWESLKFTYYSQTVLPGGGLNIPGRHINAGGYVSDGDGFIVLAGSAALGTVYNTPFGYPGKIYDRGTVGNHLDVYTM